MTVIRGLAAIILLSVGYVSISSGQENKTLNPAPAPPNLLVLVVLMPLSLFVCVVQTFVFILLSQLYLSEVSHPPHGGHAHAEDDGMEIVAPVLT